MDESAIWEKLARQQENCTRRSRVLFELFVSANFSQNDTLAHGNTY